MLRFFLLIFFTILIDTLSSQSAQGTDSIIRVSKTLPDDTNKCNILNSIAHRLCTENPEKALSYCHEALELSKRINYKKGKADALNLTGLYFYFSGEFDKAIDFLIKGYNLHDSLNNIEGKGTSANYLGNLYFSKGDISNNKNDYQRALEYFEQSYELAKKCKDSIGMSSSLNNRGTIAKRFGNYKEAEQLINESIRIRELLNDRYGLSTSFTNLANMYEERNAIDKAIEFNWKAFNILGNDVTEYDNAITYLNIGGLYLKKNKYSEGLNLVKKGYESAQKFESLELFTDACLRLSEAYKMNGDHKNALVLYEQYSKTKDSLLNSENNSQITKLQMLYETEKKNKAIALLNKTNELKESELQQASLWRKVYIFGIIFLAIVSFVIASLIYNRYKIKNEANLKLQAYNDEIEFQKKALEEKNKEITDSIKYARRIQQSLLPNEKLIEKSLNSKSKSRLN